MTEKTSSSGTAAATSCNDKVGAGVTATLDAGFLRLMFKVRQGRPWANCGAIFNMHRGELRRMPA